MAVRPARLGPKRLIITPSADANVIEIIRHIKDEAGESIALRFLDRIDMALHKLARLGHSGVSREDISPGLRLLVIGNYSVYFRVTKNETRIVRVLHSARDIDAVIFDPDK